MGVNDGAGIQLMDRENVGNLWGQNQHFPHILATYYQYINNFPINYLQISNTSTNCLHFTH